MGTLDIYHELQRRLLASPACAHCIFNLHDMSRVFAGMSLLSMPRRCVTSSQTSTVSVVRLWCHEVVRTFADRLLTSEGKASLNCMLCVNSFVVTFPSIDLFITHKQHTKYIKHTKIHYNAVIVIMIIIFITI